MNVALSDDFMEALGKLNGNEIRKASKTIMAVKRESDAKGLRAHKIEHPCDAIVSFSVNMDVRIIAHQKDSTITFLYIDHHDDAYNWIQKRNVFCGPNGDMRIVSTLEAETPLAYEAFVPYAKQRRKTEEITPEMIETIRDINSDEELFSFIEMQPEELQEKLFDMAMRSLKAKSCRVSQKFEIRVVNDDEILEQALLYPLEKWRIFLHPKQEEVVATSINESVLLTGAPGTGKTVCLVHKAKNLQKELSAGECIIISTFKSTLQDYLNDMLRALSYDRNKVFIVDVSLFNQIQENKITENLDGFFKWQGNALYYYYKNVKYRVRHVLFDEYQDFSRGALGKIIEMAAIVPFTISYDYSQSIYKAINRTSDELQKDGVKKYVLDYSYRINTRILIKLKRIMQLISILSNSNTIGSEVTEEEIQMVLHTEAAIDGSDVKLLPYKDKINCDTILEDEYNLFRSNYNSNDVIVTNFIPDFYCNLQKDSNFRAEKQPISVRKSYAYLPTLKGKEYKAGIIVLDDAVCQLLNINRLLFNKLNGDILSPKKNARFYLNLLYVAMSRFRDFITILYPEKYKETISPIFES
jgi:predicted AAA+ superfamily ATPase